MTAKRFTLSKEYESCYGYFDDEEELGGYDVLDLLNNYDKENEQLKEENEELKSTVKYLKSQLKSVTKDGEDLTKDLKKVCKVNIE